MLIGCFRSVASARLMGTPPGGNVVHQYYDTRVQKFIPKINGLSGFQPVLYWYCSGFQRHSSEHQASKGLELERLELVGLDHKESRSFKSSLYGGYKAL